MKLATQSRQLPARRAARTSRSQGRKAVTVHAMMGPYQYKARVARLRNKGVTVHEFGERMLQQGSFGDDVMQLQAYLAEQGYFNSSDGLSGYFGAVTGEAVQAWQRDQGLHVTGVFNEDCKWAALRQQEAALKARQTQTVAVVAAVPAPDAPAPSPPGFASGALGLAAVAAGVALTSPSGRAAFNRGARLAATAAAGAVAAAGRAAVKLLSTEPEQDYAGAAAAVAARKAAAAAAAAAAARKAAAEEASYLAAVASSAPPTAAPPKGPKRLSDEEVQQRIAVMKGEVSPRAPMPQRPSPKPLPRLTGNARAADDPIRSSKYGTYYGGQVVREQVKQYLEADTGIAHGARPGTPAARRLEAMGYQMSTRPRPAAAKPAPSAPATARPALDAAAPAAALQPVAAVLAAPAAEPASADPVAAAAEELLRDVIEATAVPVEAPRTATPSPTPPKQLLAGTELEASPERRGRPVPVVKAGMAGRPGPAPAAQPAAPAAPPRAVPVVKPQRRATIGDMLKASRQGGAYDPPAAALYPGGGGYGYAPTPPTAPIASHAHKPAPAAGAPQQAAVAQPLAAAAAAAPAPPRGGVLPVDTGSSYAARCAAAAVPAVPAGPAPGSVEYHSDGSVVLASKPIKLVKPAHLLPKTYGFQQMAAEEPLEEPQPLARASTDREQLGDDVFGGYRRRSASDGSA